nr:immunoglobulin light chain junction region [Macaca mulatta]MOY04938.1 immunoglobulin light chain junction region [Macaca mulatta]MOY05405.1 immunoglobulin light chain junction region [Macaca mulatta]MOY05520.1 immunoglobulin light chain junction region [Macaca mulatta]MOY05567.1 immunoglobulin light chain junction region [Macaca mulatta]
DYYCAIWHISGYIF